MSIIPISSFRDALILALWISALSLFPLRIFWRPSVADIAIFLPGIMLSILRSALMVCECFPGGCDAPGARYALPTIYRGVNVERIDLDAVTAPTGALGGKDGRSAAEKRIENDVITLR